MADEAIHDIHAVPKHTVDKVAKAVFEHAKKDGSLKGDKGTPGAAGAEGPVGPKGDKGEPGDTGARGPRGEKGDAGDKGDRGVTGPPGPKGEPGPAGPAGVQGERGPKGSMGDKGEKGDKGEVGPRGPTGVTGPKGEPGQDGVAGCNVSLRTRCTKPFNVDAGLWTRVNFDVNDHSTGGYHSVQTENEKITVAFPGCHYVSASVQGVDKVRIVMENETQNLILDIGESHCFTDYQAKKEDKIFVEVWCKEGKLVDPKGFASPVACVRKVDKAG